MVHLFSSCVTLTYHYLILTSPSLSPYRLSDVNWVFPIYKKAIRKCGWMYSTSYIDQASCFKHMHTIVIVVPSFVFLDLLAFWHSSPYLPFCAFRVFHNIISSNTILPMTRCGLHFVFSYASGHFME